MKHFLLTTAIILLFLLHTNRVQAQQTPTTVSTFHSIGIQWSPGDNSVANEVSVQFRPVGSAEWIEGFPLWFSRRESLYRGSIVHLTPDTTYEIHLTQANTSTESTIQATTWSEDFPIAQTIELPENSENTLNITQSGSPDGYILYTAPAGGSATIDTAKSQDYNISIDASYIIIRGLTLKNAGRYSIYLRSSARDVIIEENDISGWGRPADDDRFGRTDGAIHSNSNDAIQRIIIQRNRIHHPTHDTNSWAETRSDVSEQPWGTHPGGPQAVMMYNSGGNHVIRYNEVYSDTDHRYNDCLGGGSNFSDVGFPYRDSDIYGNYLEKCWDNAIESEGGNQNVRIWGNFMTETYKPIATRTTNLGPLYIWRNIFDISEKYPKSDYTWDEDPGGAFHKSGEESGGFDWGVFEFHNTLLQADDPQVSRTLGAYHGPEGDMVNTMTRNNIFHVYCTDDCYSVRNTGNEAYNDFDYDLYNGRLDVATSQEQNGITGTPTYTDGASFDTVSKTGIFTLADTSLGYDQGEAIPNFNVPFIHGSAPDIGAHEAGMMPMEFGVNAYTDGEPYVLIGSQSPQCAADINTDGIVDLRDYSLLVANFFSTSPDPIRADINADGIVDLRDYSLLVSSFFQTCP